jgi:hypothetical protein
MFRCRKKGKTCGRPSKQEKAAEALCGYVFKKYEKQILKFQNDILLYGTGVLKIDPE